MTDSIATRVTRIISASVHTLLDAVADATPEATMAQAIREVDEAIDDVRAELGQVEASKHLATSSLNKFNTQNEDLAAQIELAVAKGEEALARAGIAKQVDIEDQIPVLQRALQEAKEKGQELEGYIVALLAKKREMESALQDFVIARAAAQGSGGTIAKPGTTQDKVERAGSAFDRTLARQTGVTGVVFPLNPDAVHLRELKELARNHRIEERLAALKASKGQNG
jgi:phage shock protein A